MRADAIHRKQRILSESRRMFAEHGSDLSLDAIAEASEVGIATLYRNFPSREALIAAVCLDTLSDIDEAVAAASAGATESPEQTWERLVRTLVRLNLGGLTEALGGRHWELLAVDIAPRQRDSLARFDSLLSQLARHGTVRKNLTAIDVVVGIGIVTRPQPRPIREATPHLADSLVEAFLAWTRAKISDRRSARIHHSPGATDDDVSGGGPISSIV